MLVVNIENNEVFIFNKNEFNDTEYEITKYFISLNNEDKLINDDDKTEFLADFNTIKIIDSDLNNDVIKLLYIFTELLKIGKNNSKLAQIYKIIYFLKDFIKKINFNIDENNFESLKIMLNIDEINKKSLNDFLDNYLEELLKLSGGKKNSNVSIYVRNKYKYNIGS
jgi:hypothetical protein